MPVKAIGCCGAYCRTCKQLNAGICKGCKLGYFNGERNINKAKCKMKVCCVKKNYNTCADCHDFFLCVIICDFYSKNGYKYKKYEHAIEYIKDNRYVSFLNIADSWNGAYGKYE